MAGLCGVVALAEGVDNVALLHRLSAGLAHRGPDGCQPWFGEAAAIAHLALEVRTDIARVQQPLRLADGRICVIDGSVGDPVAVQDALGLPREQPPPSDSRLIAAAFERWGVDLWRHVDGDYALAVWNPASRELVLLRDRIGVRPMFHVRTAQFVAFCSEPEPLFELPGVDGRIRDASVVEVWTQMSITPAGWTDARDRVACLPPAHHVRIDGNGAIVLERYWRLAPRSPLRLRDESEYVDAFRHVFGEAVARATRGVGNAALMLSGGIDSGAILAASRGFGRAAPSARLLCISAVTDDATPDEGLRAETANIRALTAREPRVAQFTVPIQARTGEAVEAADAAQVAWSHLHPIDASVYIPSLACRVARQQGCPVVLNGAGGDVVTSSSPNYVGRLVLDGHWATALREATAAARTHTYLRGQSPARILARSLLAELQPRALRRLRLRRKLAREIALLHSSEFAPGFLAAAGIEARILASLPLQLDQLALDPEALRCETMSRCLADAAWGFNRMASRQGVEARDPWMDPEVVAFFLALPMQWRVRQGWTKFLVRRACEDALGPDIAWHSGKRHHGALVTRQVVVDAAPYLREFLRQSRPMLQRYFRTSFLDAADCWLADAGHLAHGHADQVNALIALAGWLERQGGTDGSRDS